MNSVGVNHWSAGTFNLTDVERVKGHLPLGTVFFGEAHRDEMRPGGCDNLSDGFAVGHFVFAVAGLSRLLVFYLIGAWAAREKIFLNISNADDPGMDR